MTAEDWTAIWLTARLAGLTTLLLLALCTPLALWLGQGQGRLRALVSSVVSLPLVLPPSVLGFYLLLFAGPHGPLGQLTQALGLGMLPFTFAGLVLASLLYSLPFVLQPIRTALTLVPQPLIEAAATLGCSPWQRFWRVQLPLARAGFLAAAVLGFAHTVGEFGVVLMLGGNIAGQTRVLSVVLYDHVEAMQYESAHRIALGLLIFSFVTLLAVQRLGRTGSPLGGNS